MFDWTLSIAVLAVFALLIGAVALWRRGVRRQAVLMVIAALVIAGNVAVWAVPIAPAAGSG
jgi:peptidoglycan/LPS O-acetylase OafA/YrhL